MNVVQEQIKSVSVSVKAFVGTSEKKKNNLDFVIKFDHFKPSQKYYHH